MLKEVNIDIGGGKRAEYFVGQSSIDRQGLYIVLEPERFKCPYVRLYPNLQLIRWGSAENWELPFASQTSDRAHLNFVYDYIAPIWENDGVYQHVISSLRRVMKPAGNVFVREPQAYMETLGDLFKEYGFHVSELKALCTNAELTRTGFEFLEWANKEKKPEESLYLPMQFTATLL